MAFDNSVNLIYTPARLVCCNYRVDKCSKAGFVSYGSG